MGRKSTALVFLSFFATFFVAGSCFAQSLRNYGPNNGYLTDVAEERHQGDSKDMVVIQPPQQDGPTLRDRIFNEKLSKEFSDRYEEKFGRTEIERVYNSPNRYSYYDDLYGLKGTAQDQNDARHAFADFMVRRLAEYHFDNFTKTSPRMHQVWEAKERLSNVAVEIQKVRFDMNYQLAGNLFDMKIVNPWLSLARIRVQMNSAAIGPGPVDEATISVGRPLTKKIFLESHYKTTDGIVSYIARESITPALGSTLTVSTFTRDTGISIRESIYLAGMTYVF